MTPFENLIHELGVMMDLTLHPDAQQSCLLTFPVTQISIQIDLDANADQILVGTQLGILPPGSYREQIFEKALCFNGRSTTPQGVLAFSEKNDSLILFQYLSIASLNGKKLHQFIQTFYDHAKTWKQILEDE